MLSVALALYRLLPLTVPSRVVASDEVGAERARRDGTLSPQQRALLGDSYVPRTERKSRAHADDASAAPHLADQPLRRRSCVADARFGAGRSADKRDCVAPMFVGIGPLSPRYVSVPAGRGTVTSSAGCTTLSNARGERGDRIERSRTPDSAARARSRGPRVESDADVDAHIASLGAASTTLLPDATGQTRPSRELSNSKVTTVSLTAVRGRRLRLRTLEERAFAGNVARKFVSPLPRSRRKLWSIPLCARVSYRGVSV